MYDVEYGYMISAILTDCSKGEKELAKRNIEEASKIIDTRESILIFDRGYPGMELIWTLEKLKIKYIFRLQTKIYESEKNRMKSNDEWVDLKVNGDRLKSVAEIELKHELKERKTIKARMTKLVLNTGEIEYLLSNIEQEIILEEEMKEAYFKRWKIEIGYDILKNKLHIENFTGKTKVTIEQDFYAQIYTFNLLQDIKNDANEKLQERNKDKNLKYEYKPISIF